MITNQELENIEKSLKQISPHPWRLTRTKGGEWWITAPDNTDHDYREGHEPIFESSGTIPQLGIDGAFIAKSPEIITELILEIRRLKSEL